MALTPQERSRRMKLNMLMGMSYAAFSSSRASAFTPLSLFSAGEVGAWYDPSDFSTMFQDSAGTTPVTAVEQPVGLIRDKSGRGNHASQSTAASRPVLSARVNQLTYTDGLRTTEWPTFSNLTRIVSGGGTPSTGSGNYTRLTATAGNTDHYLQSAGITFVSGVNYTISYEVQYVDQRWVGLSWYDGGGFRQGSTFDLLNGVVGSNLGENSARSITPLGGSRYRISISRTSATTGTVYAGIVMLDSDKSFTTVTTSNLSATIVDIGLVDLRVTNVGVNLPAYQRVGAATDYDTTGFPLYLKFDGTDDSLATGTIDPGAVDKAQVFAGVRKITDPGLAVVAELSASTGSNAGAFILAGYNTGYIWRSRGSLDITGAIVTSPAAPSTNVLTGIGDIAGDNAVLRINAAQAASDTGNQGTGNFLSYPLYIGRRGGTTSPLNCQLYSLIFRFSAANLSDADIVKTETWVNGKTGAY